MTNGRRERRGHSRRTLRSTARITAVILAGAIIARMVMLTIDLIAARHGGAPGGEITLPIYAALLPALGWYLRGTWDKTTTKLNTRKEQLQ